MTNFGNQTVPGIRMYYFPKDETLRQDSVCPNSQQRFRPCGKAEFVLCAF